MSSDEEDENIMREFAAKLGTDIKSEADPSEARVKIVEREKSVHVQSRDAKPWLALFNFIIILIAVIAVALSRDFSPPQVLPLKAKRLSHLPQFQGAYRDEMLWGTYRPGLYLGMRTRVPKGLQTGLMWFDPSKPQALQNIRHQAEDRDGLQKFGWERHDGKSFGRQEILDGETKITTSFAKRFCNNCRGGDWGVRTHLESRAKEVQSQEEESQQGSVIFYIANLEANVDILDKGSEILASGSTFPFGGWKLSVHSSQGKSIPRANFLGLHTPYVHNLTDALKFELNRPPPPGQSRLTSSPLSQKSRLPDLVYPDSNVALFQFTEALPISLDFVFTASLSLQPEVSVWNNGLTNLKSIFRVSGDSQPPWPKHSLPEESFKQRVQALSGESLTKLLVEREAAFETQFDHTFGNLDTETNPSGTKETAKAALSNMLGSVGYFHGTSGLKLGQRIVQSKPNSLLASVPSRSFFPRGFLWDEGFHELLLRKWDAKLSRDILGHWLDLLNSEGWMAREQILGDEARSRVPAEFLVQDPSAANPPTLFLALDEMAQGLVGKLHGGKLTKDANENDKEEADFLRAAFPRMKAWLEWFLDSQKGIKEGSWRWRGRKLEYLQNPFTGERTEYTRELNPKTLTSGLDDYPRASHPSKEERHLDLYCWMALASSFLSSIGRTLKLKAYKWGPSLTVSMQLKNLTLLNELHYDERASQYRDWGNHTENVRLDTWYTQLPEEYQGYKIPEAQRLRPMGIARIVDSPPSPQYVPHYGYVSLFPLMMRLFEPESPELKVQLEHLKEGGILTEFGLRSLSTQSSLHGAKNTEHDAPYWRGPIWLNINYLVLTSLKHYSKGQSSVATQANELFKDLRARLLKLTVEEYQNSGYLWENYDEEQGAGKGCRPFTGWSALMVLIASDGL